MNKIIITDPDYFPEESRKVLENFGEVVAKKFSREELQKEIKDATALLVRVDTRVDKEILFNANSLKIIATATTGLDHIDVGYAKEKGILIINLSGIHTTSTAEHTFSLILSLARKIPWAFFSLENGEWKREEFVGHELSGKILGLIGVGRIGSQVAKYAKSFGLEVIAYDPYVKDFPKEIDSIVGFEELISKSDIISIHVALSKETKNMITLKEFLKMKNKAIIVNTSRGEVINEKDLLEALKLNKISGAALDVFSSEPLNNSELIKYARNNSNLLITPHIGATTEEAIKNASSYITEKVAESLGGLK